MGHAYTKQLFLVCLKCKVTWDQVFAKAGSPACELHCGLAADHLALLWDPSGICWRALSHLGSVHTRTGNQGDSGELSLETPLHDRA